MKRTVELEKKAKLFALAGDPTRLRVLCYMFKKRTACVSDIAEALDLSIARVSHHLQVLKDNDFFTTTRDGNSICYTVANEGEFMKKLENMVCEVKVGHYKKK